MNKKELIMLKSLPLDIKKAKFYLRLDEWVRYWGEDKCYISFSGGIDSLVLSILVHKKYPNIPCVFADTGLEFPEVKEFALSKSGVVSVRPKMVISDVIKRYGYPVVSKAIAETIYKLKYQNLSYRYKNYLLNGDERGSYGKLPEKWKYLIDSDFKTSAKCCDIMKKNPLKEYEKSTGRIALMTGEMADESRLRERVYMKNGCNAFNRKSGPKSTLLGPWTRNDALTVLKEEHADFPSVYGDIVEVDRKHLPNGETITIYDTTKLKRTGCMYCLFGIHLEGTPNRLDLLSESHPKIFDYCMRGGRYDDNGIWIPDKGLGLAHVVNALNIKLNCCDCCPYKKND